MYIQYACATCGKSRNKVGILVHVVAVPIAVVIVVQILCELCIAYRLIYAYICVCVLATFVCRAN